MRKKNNKTKSDYTEEEWAKKREKSREYNKRYIEKIGIDVARENWRKERAKRNFNYKSEEYKKWQRKNYAKKKDRVNEQKRLAYKNNPKIKQTREKYRNTKEFQTRSRARNMVARSFGFIINNEVKSITKIYKKYIGCSLEYLRKHLYDTIGLGYHEDFPKNYAIDHIIPIAYINNVPEDEKMMYVKILNHYTNLTLLPHEDNLAKRDKIIYTKRELELIIGFTKEVIKYEENKRNLSKQTTSEA